MRVGLVEPAAVQTAPITHVRPEVRQQSARLFEGVERLWAADIAQAVVYMVTRPRHVAVNELLVRPTEQER